MSLTLRFAGLRSASGDAFPGPIRLLRELTLTGIVVPVTRRPPTDVGTQGITPPTAHAALHLFH